MEITRYTFKNKSQLRGFRGKTVNTRSIKVGSIAMLQGTTAFSSPK